MKHSFLNSKLNSLFFITLLLVMTLLIASPRQTTAQATVAFEYSTFLGGLADDDIGDIAVDEAGNIYVTGKTCSVDFPTSPGAFDTSYNGSCDAFVAKLNADGTGIEFATFLGGSARDAGVGIALDDSARVYLTGYTCSTDFPITSQAYDTSFNGADSDGCGDAFVARLSADGISLEYATYLGGSWGDHGSKIAIDQAGDVYVMGITHYLDFPVTPGAFDPVAVSRETFVSKLNLTGDGQNDLVYSTFLGGSRYDYGRDIVLDDAGNVYVSGYTESSDFPTSPGAFDTSHNGGGGYYDAYDAFLVKLNSDGSSVSYSTFLGSTGKDYGLGVAVDESGNAYVTGNTTSANFPVTEGAIDTSYNGGIAYYGGDIFVTKVNSSGTELIYSTFLGGTNDDFGYPITVDDAGNAHLTGRTQSSNFPTTVEAFDSSFNGNWDSFVATISADGKELVYGTFLGGSHEDAGTSMAIGENGKVYLAGRTKSSNFPSSATAFDTSYNGGFDGFMIAAVPPNQPPVADANGPYSADEGTQVLLSASASYDPDGDPLHYRWDFDGDSIWDTEWSDNPTVGYTWSDDWTGIVTSEVTDGVLTNADTASISVHNVAPTAAMIVVPVDPILVNTSFSARADFTDPGIHDTHTAEWDWGDGTSSVGKVTETGGSGSVSDTHIYTAPGVYTIKLMVTDKDGGIGESTYKFVVVYDPEGGFVTGGGWIYSESGWCQLDEVCAGAEGKANFGFVSKYKKGAAVPTGNTEFNYKAGGLNFHSSSYDWLVVNQGGTNAQYKGSGTINGAGDYKFMLWAGDNEPDTFRIKIWYEDEAGNETVVYDNGFAQPIGDGNIVVHTGKK